MAARSDPVGADIALHPGRQLVHGDEATPGGNAGEERLFVAAAVPPGFGMDAVAAHDDIAAMARAILEQEPDAVTIFLESDAAAAEMQPPRRPCSEGVQQHTMQVATVEHPVRR